MQARRPGQFPYHSAWRCEVESTAMKGLVFTTFYSHCEERYGVETRSDDGRGDGPRQRLVRSRPRPARSQKAQAVCVLKIDRSLLIDAEHDRAARIILRNVVSLCRELGIRSICEGAETDAQLAFLRDIHCDLVQGYATGRPASIALVEPLLAPR
jgi:hypothetical protein